MLLPAATTTLFFLNLIDFVAFVVAAPLIVTRTLAISVLADNTLTAASVQATAPFVAVTVTLIASPDTTTADAEAMLVDALRHTCRQVHPL